jgi:hypothetical protein
MWKMLLEVQIGGMGECALNVHSRKVVLDDRLKGCLAHKWRIHQH